MDDVEQWIVFLQSKNVAVQDVRIDEITNKKFTFFYDPNGQPLELYEDKDNRIWFLIVQQISKIQNDKFRQVSLQ